MSEFVPRKTVIALDRITVVAASDHVFGDLDGEAVILHLSNGVYYGLNSVGTRVWNLIQSPISASQILEVLLAEYEVDAAVCEKELLDLLNGLSDRGLITIKRADHSLGDVPPAAEG
jgi:hypothetical protein